jgi:secreted PhoX family phosphatase
MYVGTKQQGGEAMSRNGLDNGKLYTFVSDDPTKNSETTFTSGSLTGHWVEVPGAEALTDAQLETASDGLGAMGFVRIEDGAWSKRSRNDFFFVTTGGNKAAGNELGRLYHVRLGADPRTPATLEVVYNADAMIANGGDTAISPDNVDTSGDQLMINEDGTTQSRAVMAQKGRDGSIWRFNLVGGNNGQTADGASGKRVAQVDPPGRDGVPVGPGVWETSGIINLGGVFGGNVWLFDVQARAPTTAPAPGTVEDGQLLLMRRVRGNDD